MIGVVAIDGEVFGADEASVPVCDRGFLYGDSVYEVVRTYGGRPFALREHLERLAKSASLVEIPLPLSVGEFADEVRRVLAHAGTGEWYVRLVLTRGGGPIGLDPALADKPRRVMLILPLPEFPETLRTDGASVALVGTSRSDCGAMPRGAKTGNYLTNIMALKQARQQGAFEAILLDASGRIAEGSTSNVFIRKGETLFTPPLGVGILDGITRRKVLELCADAEIDVKQEHLQPLDLYSADEVFLTATLKEVLPVTTADGKQIGDGLPGPTALRLRELYQALTRSDG